MFEKDTLINIEFSKEQVEVKGKRYFKIINDNEDFLECYEGQIRTIPDFLKTEFEKCNKVEEKYLVYDFKNVWINKKYIVSIYPIYDKDFEGTKIISHSEYCDIYEEKARIKNLDRHQFDRYL